MDAVGVSDGLPAIIILAGAIGAACGGMLGARLARASFWKGPVVLAVAWLVSSIIVSLLAAGLSISDTTASIIGTVAFIVVAGLCGRLLKLGARVIANIILGGLLGAVLLSIVLVYVI
ncbi:hypothetical protein [Rhizobium multihospitium]|uniref:Uncharacterized protein n=1 Tax=Rhizobium multihospitium TaxID=410764 RepID=A0A1C3VB29_9HYPH|nr:hypothetical protein [Rhizobium multihospitium]SCB25040.1 hypothetical protein GA0061103_3447 [Rhizobium multihospitium]